VGFAGLINRCTWATINRYSCLCIVEQWDSESKIHLGCLLLKRNAVLNLLLEVWIWLIWVETGNLHSSQPFQGDLKLFVGYFHKVFCREWNRIEKNNRWLLHWTDLQTPKAIANVAAHLWSLLGPSHSERSRRYRELCILFGDSFWNEGSSLDAVAGSFRKPHTRGWSHNACITF